MSDQQPPKVQERCFIEESTERYSEIKLSDGTVIRIKAMPVLAFRFEGHDELGFPLYGLQGIQVQSVVVSCPEELMARKHS